MPAFTVSISRETGEITLDEWKKLVNEDDSLSHVKERSFVDKKGRTVRKPYDDRHAMWSGHPQKVPYMFVLFEGAIEIDRPDDAALEKLREIGRKLGATKVEED